VEKCGRKKLYKKRSVRNSENGQKSSHSANASGTSELNELALELISDNTEFKLLAYDTVHCSVLRS
jgi:hypothetical protein